MAHAVLDLEPRRLQTKLGRSFHFAIIEPEVENRRSRRSTEQSPTTNGGAPLQHPGDRLDADDGDDRVASRDTRELEAEAVAFVVAQSVGLDCMAASRDFIHLYRGDREGLTPSLNRIQQTASTIIRAMSPS